MADARCGHGLAPDKDGLAHRDPVGGWLYCDSPPAGAGAAPTEALDEEAQYGVEAFSGTAVGSLLARLVAALAAVRAELDALRAKDTENEYDRRVMARAAGTVKVYRDIIDSDDPYLDRDACRALVEAAEGWQAEAAAVSAERDRALADLVAALDNEQDAEARIAAVRALCDDAERRWAQSSAPQYEAVARAFVASLRSALGSSTGTETAS